MTNQEAIRILDGLKPNTAIAQGNETAYDIGQALSMAIKALEQEPKTGHWIDTDEEPHEVWECDHCGFVIDGSGCIEPYEYRDTYKYCPNCGAKMFEPQESEDKE
jgi:rubrerythrin